MDVIFRKSLQLERPNDDFGMKPLITCQRTERFELYGNVDPPWLYLMVVNVASFFLMGLDKLGAKVDSERVPEMWFFLISLAGGFCGVLIGMFTFHHKVSKTSFHLKIFVAAILGTLTLLYLVTQR